MSYIETEVKVLDVDPVDVAEKLLALGATQVFDDDRTFTFFDTASGDLRTKNQEIRLTEEEKLKLSYSGLTNTGKRETIKLLVSRKQETVDFLGRLGFAPIAEVTSHRISFEWERVDFDIDTFPNIPPFLEVDLGNSGKPLEDVLAKLGLENHEVVKMSTEDVYRKYDQVFLDNLS